MDNVTIPTQGVGSTTPVIATDDVGGVHYQRVKLDIGGDGVSLPVEAGTLLPVDGSGVTQPVSGPLTDTELRATPVPVSGTVATGGLTDIQLRATAVPVDGSGVTQPVSGSVTIAALPDEGQQTMAASISVAIASNQTAVPVSGPLTDTQLRATPVPVSGTVTATTGGLTDTQLRASAVPVTAEQATAANLNMTEASAAAIKTAVETIDNFISGSRGLVTEDSAAAIKTAVEIIDNFISGSRGLVTEDNSATIAASLSVMDDWDESDRAKVNLIAGQAGIAGGTGTDGATVPRVSLATNVPLPTGTNAIGRVGSDITGVGHGVKTVTAAGTDEALAASTACKRVTIQAQTDNTSLVAVGASGVDAAIATGTGIILYPGDSFELDIDNLADVFIDSLVNGEGVRYAYFT